MDIRFAEASDLSAVTRFNDRLRAGGHEEQITLRPSLPGEARYRPEGFPVCRRMMIAEDGQEVRAAMLLYHNNIFIRGNKRDCCWLDMPISEGIVDHRYSLAMIQVIIKALQYEPFMMAVGAGPLDKDSFLLLSKQSWRHCAVPFFFYPVKVTNVFLGLRYLKRNPKLRYGSLFAAYSGAGAGLTALLALRRQLTGALSDYESSEVEAFDDWADCVFTDSLPDYAVAVRSDATTLNIIYPPDNSGFARLRVRRKGNKQDAGWVVVASKKMSGNSYFGDLRVGTIVDGFGRTADVRALVATGLNHLAEAGVDLIVANFSHAAWVEACRRSGMLTGPSNYQLFVAPEAEPLLEESCPLHEIHVSRGHSDGMEHLV